ncbi:uncharacterized protein LOC129227286 [Uloborus diversus]|uniref:uncharacterized protein LOC129227286 n=1 Tax=Uloborus diversus TaxID=327109 RepID=UPI00240A0FDD|nr:uncharacterized protein LOC129227286 [Uloborus diversus]
MKLLVAAVVLFCVTANAYQVPKELLLGPMFLAGQTHVYNVTIDLVSSISGLSSQHARFTLSADASIYANSNKDHVLKLTNVRTTGPMTSVSNYASPITLFDSKELEDQLSVPIKFTLEKKQVTSYTLDERETLETKKIKKSILRMLELYVDEDKIESDTFSVLPITYNLTRKSPVGDYQSQYVITSSPYEEFPLERNVLNVSRSDNYENIRYPSHVFEHNFKLQGCPAVCKNNWTDNKFGAGCPSGFEPHQSHVKMYYNHHHRLVKQDNVLLPEDIDADEYHIAKSYDQKMEIFIRVHMSHKENTRDTIRVPNGQQSYTDLDDYEKEINEQEINDLCIYQNPQRAIEASKTLLNELAETVVNGDLEHKDSTLVGEKLVLLQKSLAMLKKSDLENVEKEIAKLGTLSQATDKEKVKRQIWIDLLSTIGTSSSVSYISSYIQRNLKRDLTVYEAKEILEALPENVHKANEQTIEELMKIWELRPVSEYHLLHSAAFITVGKVINKACNKNYPISSEESPSSSSWMRNYQQAFSSLKLSESSESTESSTCPTALVKSIVEKLVQKLKQTQSKQEKAIYIQTLSQINTLEAVQQLAEYSFGIAEDFQQYSPSQVNFFKVITLFALHNNINKYPQQVLKIAAPIFFNRTEKAKVRNAAFNVILRSQPSRELLEHIVHDTWHETSLEVGSYVTSSLETFGNSSMPCDQLTAQRIKMVVSQAKRVDEGYQHSKNLYYSYNDDLRSYGHEERFEYTSSGESIVPSTIYHAFKFMTRNMHEVASQTAINIEGVTSKMILDKINEYIGMKTGKPLTPSRESEIFGKMKYEEKVPEEFKMTLFNRFFYASSYYYIENPARDFAPIFEHFEKYFKSSGNYKGTYVKAMLTSTLHTVTVAKAVPFPVELELKYPYLLAIQLKNQDSGRIDPRKMRLSMKFSMYLSRLLSHHIKNLRDCKEIGTYYEHKISMNIPYEFSFDLMNWNKIKVEYGFMNLPRQIVAIKTEAGTFIGKKELDRLPQMSQRSPIKRIPEQFKREQKLDVVGLPPMHISTHTENMAEGHESIPRNIPELLEWAATRTLNAGWRSRSVNVTMDTSVIYWPSNTKISFEINYRRQQHTPSRMNMMQNRGKTSESEENEEDIVKDIDEDVDTKDARDWISRGRKICETLVSSYPHVQHVFDVQVKTRPVSNKASIRAEYNHTLGKHVHAFHMDAALHLKRFPIPLALSADHIIGYLGRPSEFKFDKNSFSQERARFLSTVSLHHAKPFEKVDLFFAGYMKRIPLSNLLNDMLVSRLDEKHFLPQDYEQCERDTEAGKALSKECMKSINEMSKFNYYDVIASWTEAKLPGIYRRLAKTAETLTRSLALGHVTVSENEGLQNTLGLNITYIDKLSDNPLIDVVLEKPSEFIKYEKLPAIILQPISSIHSIFDTYIHATTNNTYPATCTLMEKYLTTYDQKTYQLPSDQCQYLISAPCTQYKRFAVLGKTLSRHEGTKEITLYIGDHKLILSPKEASGYKVNVNGEEKVVHVSGPVLLEDEHTDLSVSLNVDVEGTFLEVYDNILGLKLAYNGKNVKIQVNPIFKGELCGLCSTFDGETVQEYLAPDGCLYSKEQDFMKRSIVNPSECHANVDPSVPHICYSSRGQNMYTQSTGNMVRRNAVKYREDTICFSVEPVSMCSQGQNPQELDEESVGFHCLPKNDLPTQKLVSEANVRELEEMRNKNVDFVELVTVAKQC